MQNDVFFDFFSGSEKEKEGLLPVLKIAEIPLFFQAQRKNYWKLSRSIMSPIQKNITKLPLYKRTIKNVVKNYLIPRIYYL